MGGNNVFGSTASSTLYLTTGTILAGSAGSSIANNVVINGPGLIFGGSSYNGLSSASSTNSNLTFTGPIVLSQAMTAAATTGLAAGNIGPVSTSGPTTIAVYNTTTFSNNVSGPGGLIVAGPGNLILAGPNNTYAGGTVLNSAGTGIASAQYTTSGGTNQITGTNFGQSGSTPLANSPVTPVLSRIDPTINYPNSNGQRSQPRRAEPLSGRPARDAQQPGARQ